MQPTLPKLLSKGNQKLAKGEKFGFLTVGIHLAPASLSGHNVCPMASKGCRLACLNTSGHGAYKFVQRSRIEKTKRFFNDRNAFMAQLIKELGAAERKAKREGQTLAVRLNLTSDVQWEGIKFEGKTVFDYFPHIQFYDYTKIARRFLSKPLPANYHLTFSRSESNEAQAEVLASMGHNVAVVFSGKVLPSHYMGRKVVSGDKTDLRFLDEKGVIVGLTTKGKAKKDKSGFVVTV